MALVDDSKYLTPGEVASLFGVTAAAVAQWERQGILPAIRTPGNQRRFLRSDVLDLLGKTGIAA